MSGKRPESPVEIRSRSPSPTHDDDEYVEEGGERYRRPGPGAPQVVWVEESPDGESDGLTIIEIGPDDPDWQEALPYMKEYTAYLLPEYYRDPSPSQLGRLEDLAEEAVIKYGVHDDRVIISESTPDEIVRAAQRRRMMNRARDNGDE